MHSGKECEACFGLGYIEEWPTERLEREKQALRNLLVEVLGACEREGAVPFELQVAIRQGLKA